MFPHFSGMKQVQKVDLPLYARVSSSAGASEKTKKADYSTVVLDRILFLRWVIWENLSLTIHMIHWSFWNKPKKNMTLHVQ